MSICRKRFAVSTNISRRAASIICAVRDITAASRRLRRPSAVTSPTISIAPIGIAELMFDFDKHLTDLAAQTVLCVGDLMLDEFVYGEVSRISPEAPTPVIACKRSELMVGGAGNVARNLTALGTACIFVGVVGDDDAGRALSDTLGTHPLIEVHLVIDAARQTTREVRFVSEHHSAHLLRSDWETAQPIDAENEGELI